MDLRFDGAIFGLHSPTALAEAMRKLPILFTMLLLLTACSDRYEPDSVFEDPLSGDRIIIRENGSCDDLNELLMSKYKPMESEDYIVHEEPWPHDGECVVMEYGEFERDRFRGISIAFSEQFDDWLKIR
jgi:hypothetical protein